MTIRKRRLGKQWYRVGRSIFIEAKGDVSDCRSVFKREYGDLATAILILKLLLILWQLWSKWQESKKITCLEDIPADPTDEYGIQWTDSDEVSDGDD